MEKIKSFQVDHRLIEAGVCIFRIDGDITTYDLRTRKPNSGDYMDNSTMHSVEHLFATFIRNSKLKDDIIYFGPMGCQTGFYLLVRNADDDMVLQTIKSVLLDIINYDGEMVGYSEIECGNYRNLSVQAAKDECRKYYDAISKNTTENMIYK